MTDTPIYDTADAAVHGTGPARLSRVHYEAVEAVLQMACAGAEPHEFQPVFDIARAAIARHAAQQRRPQPAEGSHQ